MYQYLEIIIFQFCHKYQIDVPINPTKSRSLASRQIGGIRGAKFHINIDMMTANFCEQGLQHGLSKKMRTQKDVILLVF